MIFSRNPIKKYEIGLPCMLDEVVGRIVAESGDGSWGEINGQNMYSMPLFATPHGTVFKTGVLKLSQITSDGLEKLREYDKELIESGSEMYAGYYTISINEGKPQ